MLGADAPRLRRVVEKTVRGLYFHHAGQILPVHHDIIVELRPDEFIRAISSSGELNVVDKAVFSYRFVLDKSFSMWWLVFYEATLFHAVSGSPEELARRLQRN